MQPSTRRSFLAATAVVTAGCLGLPDSSNENSRLCDVAVVNQYDGTVEAELRILEGDELLIEKKARLHPPGEGERYGDALFVQEERLPAEAGRYLVRMRAANGEWETLNTADYGEPLLVIGFITIVDDPDSPSITIEPKQGRC